MPRLSLCPRQRHPDSCSSGMRPGYLRASQRIIQSSKFQKECSSEGNLASLNFCSNFNFYWTQKNLSVGIALIRKIKPFLRTHLWGPAASPGRSHCCTQAGSWALWLEGPWDGAVTFTARTRDRQRRGNFPELQHLTCPDSVLGDCAKDLSIPIGLHL